MPNLKPVDPKEATGKTKELLDFVEQRSGRIPNMILLLANSPAALEAYLNFAGAFRGAQLSPKIRDLIGITVAQALGSDYSLSAVSAVARNDGSSEDELSLARAAEAKDPLVHAALQFAARAVARQGQLPPSEVAVLRKAGFDDAELAEIISAVALNIYRCYFNLIAQPELDFRPVTSAQITFDELGSNGVSLA